jgi:Uma2 family endonuclease
MGPRTQRLNHEHLGTEHLLLGLLREEKCFAADILHERGLELALVRDKVASGGDAPSQPPDSGKFRIAVGAYLAARQKEWAVAVVIAPRVGSRMPDIGVYGESVELTPDVSPLVCIEVLSPDDRFMELIERIDDYLARGVRYVWLLDPSARRAYVATSESGLHEFKGQVLRTENPALELPLDAVFT